MIFDDICKSKNGDKDAMLSLIKRFDPLIKKYGRKLETEDGYNDMVAEFLGILSRFNCESIVGRQDGAMVTYIEKAVYHAYTKLLRQHIERDRPFLPIDLLPETAFSHGLSDVPVQSFTFDLPKNLLTVKERKVLYAIDVLGYSAADIAKKWGTTRQNISQMHKRAVKKIKSHLQNTDQL